VRWHCGLGRRLSWFWNRCCGWFSGRDWNEGFGWYWLYGLSWEGCRHLRWRRIGGDCDHFCCGDHRERLFDWRYHVCTGIAGSTRSHLALSGRGGRGRRGGDRFVGAALPWHFTWHFNSGGRSGSNDDDDRCVDHDRRWCNSRDGGRSRLCRGGSGQWCQIGSAGR